MNVWKTFFIFKFTSLPDFSFYTFFSFPLTEIDCLLSSINHYTVLTSKTGRLKTNWRWTMTRLTLFTGSRQHLSRVFSSSLWLSSTLVPLWSSIKRLGIILHSTLYMQSHMTVWQNRFVHLSLCHYPMLSEYWCQASCLLSCLTPGALELQLVTLLCHTVLIQVFKTLLPL